MNQHTLTPKLLSIGLGAWIQFERTCKRTEVFSEQYLTHPITQLLNSHTHNRVISEFRHPTLAIEAKGPGRRPSVDFVVCDHSDTVFLALETKWLGKTSPSPEDILWDLIRLDLIRKKFGATCYFVLGGQQKKIHELFNRQGFIDKKGKGWKRPLLRLDSNATNRIMLDSSVPFRRPMLRKLYKNKQNMELPTFITTRRSTPFPEKISNQDFRIFVWELVESKSQTMKPQNSIHFHVDSSEE